jgi:hypothetical protein
MSTAQSAHIVTIIDNLEDRVKASINGDVLPRDAVEALDIVNHALTFVRHARGLELWREVLWHRRIPDEVKRALVEMIEYLLDALSRGELNEVSRVCDCLQVLLNPADEYSRM